MGTTHLSALAVTGNSTIGGNETITGSLAVTGGITGQVTGGVAASTFVAAGGTKTLTSADAGKLVQLDTAAGSVVTLPAATGTGNIYGFVTTVIATSNSHKVQVANGTDVMTGALQVVDNSDGTCTSFGTVAASDTITLNRTTTGSVKIGERFFVQDVKAGYFSVWGVIVATGSEATPFSAAV